MKNQFLLILICLTCFSVSEASDRFLENPDRQICIVQTLGTHQVLGKRCRYIDEVMVGVQPVDPQVILCAELQVMCNRKEVKASSESSENGS